MDFRNGYPIGYVSKAHGFKGHVKIHFFEEKYKQLLSEKGFLFLEISKKGVPFCIEEYQANKSVVLLEDIDSEEKAKGICGLQLVVFDLKGIDAGKESLIGFDLFNESNEKIGEITAVHDFNSNILFEVKTNKEIVLIPFHEDLLLELEEDKRRIIMQIPDGLLDN